MPIFAPRIAAISVFPTRVRSRPMKRISPCATRPGASRSWMMESPSVDFPDPLSPTTPNTCPGARSKLTSRTASMLPARVEKTVVGQDRPPRRRRRREPERDEAQQRLDDDQKAEIEQGDQRHDLPDVGDDVAEEDTPAR